MPTPKKTTRRKKKSAPEPRGLEASRLASDAPPATVERLGQAITQDGGTALGA